MVDLSAVGKIRSYLWSKDFPQPWEPLWAAQCLAEGHFDSVVVLLVSGCRETLVLCLVSVRSLKSRTPDQDLACADVCMFGLGLVSSHGCGFEPAGWEHIWWPCSFSEVQRFLCGSNVQIIAENGKTSGLLSDLSVPLDWTAAVSLCLS